MAETRQPQSKPEMDLDQLLSIANDPNSDVETTLDGFEGEIELGEDGHFTILNEMEELLEKFIEEMGDDSEEHETFFRLIHFCEKYNLADLEVKKEEFLQFIAHLILSGTLISGGGIIVLNHLEQIPQMFSQYLWLLIFFGGGLLTLSNSLYNRSGLGSDHKTAENKLEQAREKLKYADKDLTYIATLMEITRAKHFDTRDLATLVLTKLKEDKALFDEQKKLIEKAKAASNL